MDEFIKSLEGMNLEQVMARKAELEAEIRSAANAEALADMDKKIEAINTRVAELKELEKRKTDILAIKEGASVKVVEERKVANMSKIEERAQALIDTGKMTLETRALLSTNVLTPSAVKQEIGELPEVISSIVDDVNAIMVDGVGSYEYAYTMAGATAADVTEGQTIGGTGASFGQGSISPSTWGVLDSISNLVSKKTPLAYEAAVRNKMYIALRKKAKDKIVTTILADKTAPKRLTADATYALDQDFLRNLVLGFNADEAVAGGTKLYLCKEDLATLGKIRGTNEKKALYEITFEDENNGTLKEGGLAVKFSLLEDLKGKGANDANAMIYGQPKTICMPLWGNYEMATDESGHYFDTNMIGIRGIQTAGVGITSLFGIQLINM